MRPGILLKSASRRRAVQCGKPHQFSGQRWGMQNLRVRSVIGFCHPAGQLHWHGGEFFLNSIPLCCIRTGGSRIAGVAVREGLRSSWRFSLQTSPAHPDRGGSVVPEAARQHQKPWSGCTQISSGRIGEFCRKP